jgi:peptide/nickel transport system permease protein
MKLAKTKYPLSFFIGVILIGFVIIMVAGAPLFTNYNYMEQNSAERLHGLSREHIFGTDRFGRDVFSRTLYGGRITLVSSLTALIMALVVGLGIGLVCGFYKGSILDGILMRIIDVLMSFPFMVLAMVVAALFGTGLLNLLFAVAAVWWVSFARLARSIVLRIQSETYINAAKILGARDRTIIFRELLPYATGPILIQAAFELGNLILTISALSFLGLGSQPPTPEWGSMLSDGRAHFMTAPYILFGPALFIILTVLALNLIGEGFRDRLDPYEISSV